MIDGEVVAISRKGRRVVIRREDAPPDVHELPEYSSIVRVQDVDRADRWRWDWAGPDEDVELREDIEQ